MTAVIGTGKVPSRANTGPRKRFLCARGLHEDIPENEYVPPPGKHGGSQGGRRCRPCRVESMRLRRGGKHPGKIPAKTVGRNPLSEAEVLKLRRAVACLGCGAVPEGAPSGRVSTWHDKGCLVQWMPEGGDQ